MTSKDFTFMYQYHRIYACPTCNYYNCRPVRHMTMSVPHGSEVATLQINELLSASAWFESAPDAVPSTCYKCTPQDILRSKLSK